MPKDSRAARARKENLKKRNNQPKTSSNAQDTHPPGHSSTNIPSPTAPIPPKSRSSVPEVEEMLGSDAPGRVKPLLDLDDMVKDWQSGDMVDDSEDEESSESEGEEAEDDAGSSERNSAQLEAFARALSEAQRVAEEEERRRKAQPGKRDILQYIFSSFGIGRDNLKTQGGQQSHFLAKTSPRRQGQKVWCKPGPGGLPTYPLVLTFSLRTPLGEEAVNIDEPDSASESMADDVIEVAVNGKDDQSPSMATAGASSTAEPVTAPVFVVPVAENTASGPDNVKSKLEELLRNLREGRRPSDMSPPSQSDHKLENWNDKPKLRRAQAILTVKSKDKLLDVLFRSRISGMLALVNLYLDDKLTYTWREASLVASIAQGHGSSHARNLRTWLHQFLDRSILHDEDFSQAIQLHLQEKAKGGYVKAQDIVDFVSQSQQMQDLLEKMGVKRRSISLSQAYRWLRANGYRYGRRRRGMYIDGHEREDVVAYREEFIERWAEYEKRMVVFDNDGQVATVPQGFKLPNPATPFELILVTHDESTFYENDRRNLCWSHENDKPVPMRKGEGSSIMVSDFLTLKWGRLMYKDSETGEIIDPRVIFRAGKNRDGWFSSEDLLEQVDRAIDAFEGKTNGRAQALFMFDNAPSHQKRAADALSARYMPKGPSETWTPKGGVRMRDAVLPNGDLQPLYFPEDHPTHPGWFKGMEQIIRERGLWPDGGLLAQCTDFKCEPGKTDCCCRRLLFTQPDFASQKSALEELITGRGHICDFYPKYHCELNFIEQYWGAAKLRYRNSPQTKSQDEMEKNMLACLDEVTQVQMIWFANRSARFISAYRLGKAGWTPAGPATLSFELLTRMPLSDTPEGARARVQVLVNLIGGCSSAQTVCPYISARSGLLRANRGEFTRASDFEVRFKLIDTATLKLHNFLAISSNYEPRSYKSESPIIRRRRNETQIQQFGSFLPPPVPEAAEDNMNADDPAPESPDSSGHGDHPPPDRDERVVFASEFDRRTDRHQAAITVQLNQYTIIPRDATMTRYGHLLHIFVVRLPPAPELGPIGVFVNNAGVLILSKIVGANHLLADALRIDPARSLVHISFTDFKTDSLSLGTAVASTTFGRCSNHGLPVPCPSLLIELGPQHRSFSSEFFSNTMQSKPIPVSNAGGNVARHDWNTSGNNYLNSHGWLRNNSYNNESFDSMIEHDRYHREIASSDADDAHSYDWRSKSTAKPNLPCFGGDAGPRSFRMASPLRRFGKCSPRWAPVPYAPVPDKFGHASSFGAQGTEGSIDGGKGDRDPPHSQSQPKLLEQAEISEEDHREVANVDPMRERWQLEEDFEEVVARQIFASFLSTDPIVNGALCGSYITYTLYKPRGCSPSLPLLMKTHIAQHLSPIVHIPTHIICKNFYKLHVEEYSCFQDVISKRVFFASAFPGDKEGGELAHGSRVRYNAISMPDSSTSRPRYGRVLHIFVVHFPLPQRPAFKDILPPPRLLIPHILVAIEEDLASRTSEGRSEETVDVVDITAIERKC
ncbi:hypothetical protein NMY22_g12088 [Coprinellus aureogranulatus]|nr:hypothetical protein NMY22_g12088 [Coprinellus aureogranulatus]